MQDLLRTLQSDWEQSLLQHLTDSSTNQEMESVAQILVEAYHERSLSVFPDDADRLRALAKEGWQLLHSNPHGANNCLLDSLLLALGRSGVIPMPESQLNTDMRARLCQVCRESIHTSVDASVVSVNGICTFLDAHTHGPAAVRFLYENLRAFASLPPLRPNFEIRVYSRFDSADVDPERLGIQVLGQGEQDSCFHILRLYNHTAPNGSGYHFDALLWARDRVRKADPESSSMLQHTYSGTSATSRDKNKRRRTVDAEAAGNVAFAGTPVATEQHVQSLLQNFLAGRGASVTVTAADAATIVANWHNREELSLKLHTLLQAGLVHADSGVHAARRLVDQWLSYWATCRQGPGQRLGERMTNTTETEKPSERPHIADKKGETAPAGSFLGHEKPRESAPKAVQLATAPSPAAGAPTQRGKRNRTSGQARSTGAKRSNVDSHDLSCANATVADGQHRNSDTPEEIATRSAVHSGGHGVPHSDRASLCQEVSIRPSMGKVHWKRKQCDRVQVPLEKAWVPTHRLRGKTSALARELKAETLDKFTPPMSTAHEPCSLDDASAPLKLRVTARSQDPRAQSESAVRNNLSAIRRSPTLPQDRKNDTALGYDLPLAHCAFENCDFKASSDHEVLAHVTHAHAATLRHVANSFVFPIRSADALAHAYQQLLTAKCQESPPVANCSIDRRCLRQFRACIEAPDLQELVCFVCARRYAYVPGAKNQTIEWHWLQENGKILNCKDFETLLRLSLEGYRGTYMTQSSLDVQATMREELEDWACNFVYESIDIDILCCPEDKRCVHECGPRNACQQCEAPVCASCWGCLVRQACPPEALANDMMVFYAPKEIYEHDVTFMELVCASPCITTMVCFSLEKKYRQHRMFDEKAFMNEFRVAARGNATTFPLPWENLLDILQATTDAVGAGTPLPHTGTELKNFVSVILKSNEPVENEESLSKFIHQAVVRRQVVIDLILGALARGHRGYQPLTPAAVRIRAQALPENGVPPEVIAVLANDGQLSAIKRSKAATLYPKNNRLRMFWMSSSMA